MDASKPTGQGSTANSLQPHDPRYKESTGIDISTRIDHGSKQRLRKDSEFANPDGQARFPPEEVHLTSSVDSQPSAELTSSGPHDGFLVNDATPDSQGLQQLSYSSERQHDPGLNWDKDSEGKPQCPDIVLSEHHRSSIDGLGLELEVG